MSVSLKVTLGTVNYTDWLHVTANLVSDPGGTPVWQDWIDVPITNYNFVIPNLQPTNYYVRYYDAPTNVALGTLVAELLINALTGETIYERRFYTVNGGGAYDPAIGDTSITDPYFEGKNITGVFKESFRYLKDDEYTFDDPTYTIGILIGGAFADLEVITVEIRHNASNSTPTSGGGLYTGTITLTGATETISATDVNKRARLKGSAATQVVTMFSLASVADGDGMYFDNSVGGVCKQVTIRFPGTDKLLYNGLDWPSNLFADFWVDRGDHLKITKVTDGPDVYWEVIGDYNGQHVGEKVTLGYAVHPNILLENRQLIDGDEFPKFYYWVTNILPSTHKYTIATVTDLVFVETADTLKRIGQFLVHPTLKKFRMPDSQLMSERGLKTFVGGGTGVVDREIDYPGGYQNEMLLQHAHSYSKYTSKVDVNTTGSTPTVWNSAADAAATTTLTGGTEQRVKNIGVIFGRRI